MGKFIYVFTEDDKDKMLLAGFSLIRADSKNKMFVFENKNTMNFSLANIKYVLSDMLTFS